MRVAEVKVFVCSQESYVRDACDKVLCDLHSDIFNYKHLEHVSLR